MNSRPIFTVEKCRKFTNNVVKIKSHGFSDIIGMMQILYGREIRLIMETHEIERLIRSLGIGANYRGYHYLSLGVSLCLQDENYLLSISKLLYPKIAHTYCTTACSVERDIRTVVRICWERGDKNLLENIAMHSLEHRPTTGEFIDILVGYIKYHKKIPLFS